MVKNEDCHGVAESEAGQKLSKNIIIVSNYALASHMQELKGFTHVYVLLSVKDTTRRYIGMTNDLEARLKSHNQGNNPHTSKYRPWQIETAIAFRSREKAAAFKNSLKVILGGPLHQSISKPSKERK
jgi:predicted GIY-YIG superfamily endonuclease